MLSLKVLFESVVGQGRRALLKATRSNLSHPEQIEYFKLSEVPLPQRVGRPQPKGVISTQHCLAEGSKAVSNSCTSISSRGGIVNLLRPITTRIFNGLVRRVSSPLFSEARRKTARQLFGETAPYFALVGVTLVSGPERGLLTAQDELEAVCEDIRVAISRAGWIHNPSFWKQTISNNYWKENPDHTEEFSLSNFELGSAINKGCNAVVYAAKWKEDDDNRAALNSETSECTAEAEMTQSPEKVANVLEDILNKGSMWSLNQIQSNSGGAGLASTGALKGNNSDRSSLEDDSSLDNFSDASSTVDHDLNFEFENDTSEKKNVWNESSESKISDFQSMASTSFARNSPSPLKSKLRSALNVTSSIPMTQNISLLLSSADLSKRKVDEPHNRKRVKFKDTGTEKMEDPPNPVGIGNKIEENSTSASCPPIESYPLAIKMMFNYEAESNAPAILRAMYKETLPAKSVQLDHGSIVMKQRLLNTSVSLPSHPNIVDMPCVFVDRIPSLSDGLTLYPDALPKRINPTGYGRNMSLFCVMQRYDCTLTEYLAMKKPIPRVSLLLFTQLLEAINHIHKYGISHRDLKSDNILLCLKEGMESPRLVISDFGCCLPDPNFAVSFPSYESDPRVGNAALMAPEIKSAVPGLFTKINYSKADLWACGSLAYEIFGLENPFASFGSAVGPSKKPMSLDSGSYRESQVPKMPKSVPAEIRYLVHDMLKKNPKQRPSPTVASTLSQLSLWAPRKWLNRHSLAMPSHGEVMQWLLCLSTKVLCEAGSTSTEDPKGQNLPDSVHDKKGGVLEYEIVSTFLKRIHYNDVVEAIRWVRAY